MRLESTRQPDKDESSDSEDGGDARAKKNEAPRRVPPRLPLERLDKPSAEVTRPPIEATVRPPLFEGLIKADAEGKEAKAETDDDEDEEEAKPSAEAVAEDAQAEAPAEEAQEAEETVIFDAKAAQDEKAQFEAAMEQMGPEYAAATSGETLDDVPDAEATPEPPADVPEQTPVPPLEDEPDEPPTPPSPAAGGGATPPPPPPRRPTAFGSPSGSPPNRPRFSFNQTPPPPGPNWNVAPTTPNFAPTPAWANAANTLSTPESERDAERRGLRRGLVAGFITGYVLKSYLAHRKLERFKKATEERVKEHQAQVTTLEAGAVRLREQLAEQAQRLRHAERPVAEIRDKQPSASEKLRPTPEAKPAASVAEKAPVPEQEQIFDQEGNEIILQPGWRVERSAGGYSVVLDEHNRVVHDAIRYGKEFKRDQKREQLSVDLFGPGGVAAASAAASDAATPGVPLLPGSQPTATSEPPASQPQRVADVQHRLPKPPRNQLLSAAASPWLWTAVAFLLIVYFIAALA